MNIAGDVMLGRLIDQLQPIHCDFDEPTSQLTLDYLKEMSRHVKSCSYSFGNLKSEFLSGDLNMINLETSITDRGKKWPKTFNYRMHPLNVQTLLDARIHHCSLANNHILDYGLQGLYDSMHALRRANISFAGVGSNFNESHGFTLRTINGIRFAFYSTSDHPLDWSQFDQFHFLDSCHPNLKKWKESIEQAKEQADFIIVSVHWGPNYQFYPSSDIVKLAHEWVDMGVDLIHGHSSHHIQGIEIYKGKLILYGCGDFIDDYAVNSYYRNDLTFLYKVCYEYDDQKNSKEILELKSIELIPSKIQKFQVNRLDDAKDYALLWQRMQHLCQRFHTNLIQLPNENFSVQID